MRENQKKIINYLKKTINLKDKELNLDYDNNSVILIDTILDLSIILHFIYINNTIVLISNY